MGKDLPTADPVTTMNGVSPASDGQVVNLVGFLTGALLYLLLVALVVHGARVGRRGWWSSGERLPLITGLAGLVWNLGGVVATWLGGVSLTPPPPWLLAISFAALGTLPACIVHSLFQGGERVASPGVRRTIPALAWGLSGLAALTNAAAAAGGLAVPARPAVWMLTGGFTLLTAVVLLLSRGGPVGRRGVWVAALSIFAVSSWHFEQHGAGVTWWVELLLHHASIPLALAILHQDYRFAFADLFLKHALALLALMGLSASVFTLAIVPLVFREAPQAISPGAFAMAVLLWAATAACLPLLMRASSRLVDRIVLRRVDYSDTLATLDDRLQDAGSEEAVHTAVVDALVSALHAEDVTWVPDSTPAADRRLVIAAGATLVRPDTVSEPRVAVRIGTLGGGRRLLSDDLELLGAVARLAARRLDALRVATERLEASLREQRMTQLTTEAELRALRAQINPHFLFNALTTIGYLIQAAPERALQTLLKLTDVLRGALRQSQAEFVPLQEELALVRAYLDIEMARFEDRLQVSESIGEDVLDVPVPPFVLQPIVENAIKHGIAPRREGGTVHLSARRHGEDLILTVTDPGTTGAAASVGMGVGLRNIERRLDAHFGARAALSLSTRSGAGTTVQLTLPLSGHHPIRGLS